MRYADIIDSSSSDIFKISIIIIIIIIISTIPRNQHKSQGRRLHGRNRRIDPHLCTTRAHSVAALLVPPNYGHGPGHGRIDTEHGPSQKQKQGLKFQKQDPLVFAGGTVARGGSGNARQWEAGILLSQWN